jgi:hypothetical protein
MSQPPRQSRSRRGHRLLLWAAAVVIGALVCGGIPVLYVELSNSSEQRKEDKEISGYLSLVQGNDHSGADAMLCGGDDTRTATLRDTDEPDWGQRRIEAFAIVGSEEWSSWVDGHGRIYHVRLTFADGSTAMSDLAVEVISNDPCIATGIPF